MPARPTLLAVLAFAACRPEVSSHELAVAGGQAEAGLPGVLVVASAEDPIVCTGVAVAPRVVLTAKHCTIDTSPEDWRILVGDEPLDQVNGGQIADYRATDLRMTPGEGLEGEDVSAIILSEDFGFETYPWASVLPDGFGNGSEVTLVGYGRSVADDLDSFGRKYRRSATVYDIAETVFYADTGGCNGDSGGPAFDAAGTVVGIESAAAADCSGLTIFERVDAFAGIIQQAIDDSTAGADGDADGDTDADADADTDADADADVDAGADNGDSGPDPDGGLGSRGAGAGCRCGIAVGR